MDNATSVIVAGGAGYIGSHRVRMLRGSGFAPLVVDNLAKGDADAVHAAPLRVGDINTIIAQAWQWEQRMAQTAGRSAT